MLKLNFDEMEAVAIDLINGGDGFLFLRLLAEEVVANAIFAYLMTKENRAKTWGSRVTVRLPGQNYDHGICADKVPYRGVKARLRNGMVDLAVVNSGITAGTDGPEGFWLATMEDGVPAGFFRRLNSCCDVPMKKKWAARLWEAGTTEQQFTVWEQVRTRYGPNAGLEWKEKNKVETPVSNRNNDAGGDFKLYHVKTGGSYRWAWYKIVLGILSLDDLTNGPINERPEEEVDDE